MSIPRAKNWLDQSISKMCKDGPYSQIDVLVSRKVAEVLLAINTKNRKFKENQMPGLCAALTEGRWINTGHPVIISSDGLLQDGQHRLTAIVRTNIAANMDLRFGVDPRAFMVTDMGARRGAGDTLQIAGYTDPNILAAAVRILIALETDHVYLRTFSNDVCLGFVESHPLLREGVRMGHNTGSAIKASPSACAAAAYLIVVKHGSQAGDDFFTELRAGAGPNFAKPSAPMPRLLAAIKEGRFTTNRALVAAIVIAFNAHAAGRALRSKSAFDLIAGEPFPVVV